MENKKARAVQRYRKVWESIPQLEGWLSELPGEPLRAYCNVCKIKLQAHKSSLLDHKKSAKHLFLEMSQAQQTNGEITVAETPMVNNFPEAIHFIEETKSPSIVIGTKKEEKTIVKRESVIWKFFTKLTNRESRCNLCSNVYKTAGNTTNLRKHLQFHHEDTYKDLLTSPQESFNMWISEQKRRGWNKHHTELDLFGKCVAAQMKKLPEEQAIKLTIEIQNMIGQARLEEIQEQRIAAGNNAIQGGADFQVRYMDGGQIVIVSNDE